MSQSIQQRMEWLQSQGQVKHTVESLTKMINVQTGVIEALNEELIKLRDEHVRTQDELKAFMSRQGFNYPKP
jgi:hypothetical protein